MPPDKGAGGLQSDNKDFGIYVIVITVMKALIQRTSGARVTVDGKTAGQIESGLVILLGVKEGDTEKDADNLINKIVNLRVFPNEKGHFEKSLIDMNSEGEDGHPRLQNVGVLVVSQFTLYGSTKKGRRPDFIEAAKPGHAEKLYDYFVKKMRETGLKTETGKFGAMMDVHLTNTGPVTFMIET
jgi:D-aminoacyl-tRNA deacylase